MHFCVENHCFGATALAKNFTNLTLLPFLLQLSLVFSLEDGIPTPEAQP
jgi:hypothetical protein